MRVSPLFVAVALSLAAAPAGAAGLTVDLAGEGPGLVLVDPAPLELLPSAIGEGYARLDGPPDFALVTAAAPSAPLEVRESAREVIRRHGVASDPRLTWEWRPAMLLELVPLMWLPFLIPLRRRMSRWSDVLDEKTPDEEGLAPM